MPERTTAPSVVEQRFASANLADWYLLYSLDYRNRKILLPRVKLIQAHAREAGLHGFSHSVVLEEDAGVGVSDPSAVVVHQTHPAGSRKSL